MGFTDVYDEECDFALVLVVELVEGGNLPPEWRSRVAAEDHHYGLGFVEFGELNGAGFIDLCECEVGGGVANVNRASAGVGPQGFEWADEEDLPGEMHHYAGKAFGRAVHDAPHEANESCPKDEDYDENAGGDF
jgi:hypothetical protein